MGRKERQDTALRPQSGSDWDAPTLPAQQHPIAPHISLKQDQEIPSSKNFPSNFINRRCPLGCSLFNNIPLLIQEANFPPLEEPGWWIKAHPAAAEQDPRAGVTHSFSLHTLCDMHSPRQHLSTDLVLPASESQGHSCLDFGKHSDLPAKQDFSKHVARASILKQGKSHKKQRAEKKLFA